MPEQRLYAIKAPSGALLWDTARSSRTMAWDAAYHRHLYRMYAGSNGATKAAYRRGWRCVPVAIVELPKEA
jgi:hypothetical protein